MKKNVTLFVLIASIAFIGFSCKKSSTSSSSSNTPTTAPVTNTSGSTFSVNGTSQTQSTPTLIKGVSNNADYVFNLVGSSWDIEIVLPGTSLPANGSYSLQDSTDNHLPAGKGFMTGAGPGNQAGVAHSGVVTVSGGNTIAFTNIVLIQPSLTTTVVTSYTVTGTIKY